uniref:B3 domain-containing transcription factor n=1 Tax=Pohlia nutans TaxID=140635 RepID=A0A4D6QH88_9BRYO|nr:B3 domain-containing transcription factor [Pohlia nutans]
MESSKGDLWLDPTQALPSSIPFTTQPVSVSGMEKNQQGSGDYSSGSFPSCSSTSSEQTQSPALVMDGGDDVSAMLKDDEVRAMLKKVTVNEGVLNKAIQSLGGGEKGLKSLMGYIMLWVKQQRDSKQQKSTSNPPLSCGAAGDVALQQNSDAFHILSGILQPQVPEQDLQPFQRFKSRRLAMDAGLGVDTGYCPSSFMNVGVNPEEYKPEIMASPGTMASPGIMASSPGIMAIPCIPQLSYGVMQQPVMLPVMPFTSSHHIGMPSVVEQTPAMTTKAARRHRMARQRQSMMNQHHARAANSYAAAATPAVSVGGGSSSWSTANSSAPPVKKSHIAQIAPQSATPVTATRKGRNMESLTLLLQKELRPSDVGNLGRIILPKKEAEQHMPFLAMRGGISIQMEDFDSGRTWNLRYRFWPNNKNRMYLLENTGEFVKSHHLVEGDQLILYRTQQGGYVLRGKKKKTQRLDVGESVEMKFAHSSAKGSLEEPSSPKEKNGFLVQRLYGGGPPEKGSVKEEPVTLDDDDPFLKEMMLSMGPSFGADSSCLQTLERFPSLNLDFPLDEIMAVAKMEPEG